MIKNNFEDKTKQLLMFDIFSVRDSKNIDVGKPYLNQELFSVNYLQCCLYSKVIQDLIKNSEDQDTFSLKNLSNEDQVKALFHIIGICERINWNFALGELTFNLWNETKGFSYEKIKDLNAKTFRCMFGNYSRDDGKLFYSRRLKNLKNLSSYYNLVNVYHKLSQCNRVLGKEGAIQLLKNFPVYCEDRLLKKANAFLNEVSKRKLVSFIDADEIEPAIDYHILRLYLRTGRILFANNEIVDRLVKRTPMRIELITKLRETTKQAMKYTAWTCNMPIPLLNHIEWAYARKACRRDRVWCKSCDFYCVISDICYSYGKNTNEMLTEPTSLHGHY